MAELTDEQKAIAAVVQAGVVRELKESGNLVILPPLPPAAPVPKDHDPYRPMLQFIAGLLAFSLTLIVGLFAALGIDKGHTANTVVVWVLIGMIAAASFGTIAALLLQGGKSRSPDKFGRLGQAGVVAAVVAVVLGVAAAGYGVCRLWQMSDVACIKVAEGIGEQALRDLLAKNGKDAKYAEGNMKHCFATGDLVSSVAWAKVAAGPAKPIIQAPQ